MIPLYKPTFAPEDFDAVQQSMRSGCTTMGPKLVEFERQMARQTRRTHGIGVNSGSLAIEISLRALGIGPGDEVLVSAFGYSANVNSVLHVGATPVFVDVDPRTMNMDPAAAEQKSSPKTRAMLVAETFGNPAGFTDLIALCTQLEIPMIENGTEGLGGTCGKDNIGRFGRIACFGFFASRLITTGEGGMIVTHDDHLAAACRAIRHQGRVDRYSFPDQPCDLGMKMEHAYDGYDGRLPEMNAALGLSQLQRLDATLAQHAKVAQSYTRRLGGEPDILLPNPPQECKMSWSNFVIRLSDRFTKDDRDQIIDGMHRLDIGAADWWPCAALLPHVRKKTHHEPGDFPLAERLSHRTIALPFFESISESEIDDVCQTLKTLMSRVGATRE
ncbi:MAG: DegT/DnrJ/EryC1/StrS aminotransferase family protein [Planctomycetes bacterium]|nr:DegT/DnrJ/EryC1/StrS aminotransferase family protein [Planctomycetota bacterium]